MIDELRNKLKSVKDELKTIKQVIKDTDEARRINESSYTIEAKLKQKYYKIVKQIEQIDACGASKELQLIVEKIIDHANEDSNNFKFFEKAKANFSCEGKQGRELHVKIICSQVCDHDIKKVLEDAEKVTGRKLIDWFVSASIGYNSDEDAKAWITYHLTFKGDVN